MEVNGQFHIHAVLSSEKTPHPKYPLNRRLSRPQGRPRYYGEAKFSCPFSESNSTSLVIQPVGCCYTDSYPGSVYIKASINIQVFNIYLHHQNRFKMLSQVWSSPMLINEQSKYSYNLVHVFHIHYKYLETNVKIAFFTLTFLTKLNKDYINMNWTEDCCLKPEGWW